MNSEKKSNRQSDWETCVVCGSSVEPGRGAARFNHRGNTISVCGAACQETFAQEPDLYLARMDKKMREQLLRESPQVTGLDDGLERGFHDETSHLPTGTKRELVKCVATVLLLSSVFIASVPRALSAEISTTLSADPRTKAAAPLQTTHEHETKAAKSLFDVSLNLPPQATAVKNIFDDYLQEQNTGLLGWCGKCSSNLLTHIAVARCAQTKPLQEGINWSASGLARAMRSAGPRKTFRLFDEAVISVGPSRASSGPPDGERAFLNGYASGRSWAGPNAAGVSQGLRLFSWSW